MSLCHQRKYNAGNQKQAPLSQGGNPVIDVQFHVCINNWCKLRNLIANHNCYSAKINLLNAQ